MVRGQDGDGGVERTRATDEMAGRTLDAAGGDPTRCRAHESWAGTLFRFVTEPQLGGYSRIKRRAASRST